MSQRLSTSPLFCHSCQREQSTTLHRCFFWLQTDGFSTCNVLPWMLTSNRLRSLPATCFHGCYEFRVCWKPDASQMPSIFFCLFLFMQRGILCHICPSRVPTLIHLARGENLRWMPPRCPPEADVSQIPNRWRNRFTSCLGFTLGSVRIT